MPADVSCVPWNGREMPKSITCGPSSASSTLAGLRSRWITPAACTARSASASPAASRQTAASGSGPCSATMTDSGGPGTYAVASQGEASVTLESTTGAVYMPPTERAAVTSWLNRRRNSGSAANCEWMTLMATARPAGEKPRYTCPMPPAPSRECSRNSPIMRGSFADSGSIPAPHATEPANRAPARRDYPECPQEG